MSPLIGVNSTTCCDDEKPLEKHGPQACERGFCPSFITLYPGSYSPSAAKCSPLFFNQLRNFDACDRKVIGAPPRRRPQRWIHTLVALCLSDFSFERGAPSETSPSQTPLRPVQSPLQDYLFGALEPTTGADWWWCGPEIKFKSCVKRIISKYNRALV